MKKCKTCGEEKPLSEFYQSSRGYYQSDCKPCNIKRSGRYAKENPEKRYAHHRAWRERNHNKINVKSQQILDGMVSRSRKKGFDRPEFTRLEIEQIVSNGVCIKTGIPFEFDQSKYSKSPWTPVPDRIDNTIGYTKENVQWVCHMYNSMKQEYTDVEIEIFLSALFERRNNL